MKINKFELLIYIINNIEKFYLNDEYVIYRIKYKIIRDTLCINVGYLTYCDSELATDITGNVKIKNYIIETRKLKIKQLERYDNNKKRNDDLYTQ